MINGKDFSSNMKVQTEQVTFKTTKELMYSKEVHFLLHNYCIQASDEDKELMQLIDTCFTERGSGEDDSDRYIDVWKASKMLLDIFNGDFTDYKDAFTSNQLKVYFKRFLGGFYNYFFTEYKPHCIDVDCFVYGKSSSIFITEKQGLLTLITDTFRTIMVNLEKHDNE